MMDSIPQPGRIIGRTWVPEQLHALALADREAQRHVEHMSARLALVDLAHLVDSSRIRAMVVESMGGIAGTYYMVAALLLAELAITYPQHLTDTQYNLLLSPLQAAEQVEETVHTDLDAQFTSINDQSAEHLNQSTDHLAAGDPVISIDTKKKELVGLFTNRGKTWRPAGDPVRVNVHDFPDPELGKSNPYGIYDVSANDGWISVGTDHDTAAFAMETIRHWFDQVGHRSDPTARRLLACADGRRLQRRPVPCLENPVRGPAAETGPDTTACHLPPGTSKGTTIAHRLFPHRCHELARPAPDQPPRHHRPQRRHHHPHRPSGHAELEDNIYPAGIKISDTEIAALPINRYEFHGE